MHSCNKQTQSGNAACYYSPNIQSNAEIDVKEKQYATASNNEIIS